MFKKSAAPAAGGPYTLSKSLRFRSSASAYLNRTFSTPTSTKKCTFSFWIKRGTLSTTYPGVFTYNVVGNTGQIGIYFDSSNQISFFSRPNGSTTLELSFTTNAVYRDVASWYHVVIAIDTTQASSTNGFNMYVNGVAVTSWSSNTYTQNSNLNFTNGLSYQIGAETANSRYFDGYLSEFNFIDGQQLTPSSFGSFSGTGGVWQPIKYTGTYGTNGFYLKFTDTSSTSALGTDSSGNGNTWTVNNISLTAGSTYDSMTDVPTLTSATVANYPDINPLTYSTSGYTITDGNLKITGTSSSTLGWNAYGTMEFPTTGKWYFEWNVLTVGAAGQGVGIALTSSIAWGGTTGNPTANAYMYLSDGTKLINGTQTAYGATYTSGDVIGIAFDAGAGTLTFYKNNASQGSATTGLTGSFVPYLRPTSSTTTPSVNTVNFGQQPFTYTPPSGYVALNTYNLSTPTIAQGNKYMDATIYTGTGANSTITNTGSFKPDFVWIKGRTGATNHYLYDSIRGANVQLLSNSTNAESTIADRMTSFNTNGFSVGTSAEVNQNTYAYVGWNWQAGQGSTSSNTNGSITSTVSVSTTAGFSIVTWTANGSAGATIGHGLGVTPSFIILKDRTGAQSWIVYHSSLGNTQYIVLNSTGAVQTSAGAWNNTSPTSSVFTVGGGAAVNTNGDNMLAYCWTPIAGFSAFGSYTGNASTDGPFVYTGFKPKYILVKNISNGVADWTVLDGTRNPYNLVNLELNPDLANAESTANTADFLSNGFKLRSTFGNTNGSGSTLIYAAFAENPFKYALAR